MSLQRYLRMALKEARLTSDTELIKIQHLTGTLKPGRENLILIYGGSFNPIHRGHIDVLLSGLRPEIGAVAIIVLPSEDFHLRNKVANSHPEFFLRRNRRADIWDAVPSIPKTKVWVWSNTWYPFKLFLDALIRFANSDGFDVAFSNFIGPDNLNLNNPLMIMPYDFSKVMVTNKARHFSSHFLPDGKPAKWSGFGEWSRCTREHGNGKEPCSREEVVLWTCAGVGDNNMHKRGYYLQFAKSVSVDVNSTELRRSLLETHHLNETKLNQLSTGALLELLAPVPRED